MSAPPAPAPQFKLKQRKREAVTKHEPEAFRDALLKIIPENADEIEKYASLLELNESKLDYKRYGESFFEFLIVGGLIAPGGVIEDGPRKNPFSIFAAEDSKEAVRARVDIMNRLIRRYKYLERRLEECMSHLLQYVNKFGDNTNKLARATGRLISMQLLSISVLGNMMKEHLVKDGAALQFVTGVFRSYLEDHTIDQLSMAIKKGGLDTKLLEFFPPGKREAEYVARHFETEGLKPLVEYFNKKQQSVVKEQVKERLFQIFVEGTPQEAATYIKQQMSANSWTEGDVVPIIWEALISSTEWSTRPEQLEGQIKSILKTWGKVLAVFCTSAKTELSLILLAQQLAYQDGRFQKHFRSIIKGLYDEDAVSESAIVYWYEKGAGAQGKTLFVKQMEPFVAWLKSQEDEEEEGEEDDE
ncbi:armadillo-type protein [Fimicolochytrium jonesii]|uniref:armadillo-type protein n=1 Tax=Fimicolochytrium jonesii TaxID=1396493 RepID=UPI0022FEDB43|nr:armadillo-type protein [Fimicolochytrium jonesii]KAI8826630.1 armadillo-type protein [Fimicolochytrium jonesii]